jgi:glycosyltransferase involved in cell wall biosynthesis
MVQLYNLCELFVFPSWHEGFGLPALEAMSCGVPVIGANTTSLPEVIGREDALFDPFDEKAISQKIVEVLTNEYLRNDLARHSLEQAKKFSWDDSAKRAISAFERWHDTQHHQNVAVRGGKSNPASASWLIERIAKLSNPPVEMHDWLKTAQAIAQNHPASSEKQLLVDISELVHRDAKSGIQRVVRSVLAELLANPPQGFRVEPVYATPHEPGYRYARQFTQRFLCQPEQLVEDGFADMFNGDIFFGLDLQPHVVFQQATFYAHLRRIGVQVYFVVYDLLPVLLPKMFPDGSSSNHAQWLSTLAQTDGVLCISRAVADEMVEWLAVFGPERLCPLKLGWFHLGADVACSAPSKGLPNDASDVLKILSRRPTFLSVGTIEPRKGQLQTLVAFERLWAQGVDVNLVLVGKHGWNVDLLVEMLRHHSERNQRLFWLEGVSDEYLEKVYAASTCLIAASEGEGFGLPLIEAAQHKKPIIARDIPVFREVAGEHAFYFSGCTPDELADGVVEWLALDKAGLAPQSNTMPWLTWRQSTQNLMDVMLDGQWYQQWIPDDVHRFWGSDSRLGTQVGTRTGRDIASTGEAGYLVFGPYIPLAAGHYRIVIRGALGKKGAVDAYMDVAVDKGTVVVAESALDKSDIDGNLVSMQISLDKPCTDFEVRVWVNESTDLQVSMIEIAPWQGELEIINTNSEDIAKGGFP